MIPGSTGVGVLVEPGNSGLSVGARVAVGGGRYGLGQYVDELAGRLGDAQVPEHDRGRVAPGATVAQVLDQHWPDPAVADMRQCLGDVVCDALFHVSQSWARTSSRLG